MNTLKVKETVFCPGRPKVTVPVVGTTPEQIIEECENIRALPCDVIEWRADYYLGAVEDLNSKLKEKDIYLELIKILDDINYIAEALPVIFTIRSKAQGGQVKLTDPQKDSIWSLVAESGLADMIDIELFDENGDFNEERVKAQIDEIHECGVSVILSHHDFNTMPKPGELVSIARLMNSLGADMCKIAAMASVRADAEGLLKATAFLTKNGIGPLAMMAMGEEGKSTRVAAGKYGSCLTFAAGMAASAPGQVDTLTLKKWLDDYYGEEE